MWATALTLLELCWFSVAIKACEQTTRLRCQQVLEMLKGTGGGSYFLLFEGKGLWCGTVSLLGFLF